VVLVSPESKTNITLQFEQPVSLLHSHFEGSANLVRSVFMGINASLCASASSARTEEFSMISTVSMAKTGIPLRQILRKALAYSKGISFSFTDIRCLSWLTISREYKS